MSKFEPGDRVRVTDLYIDPQVVGREGVVTPPPKNSRYIQVDLGEARQLLLAPGEIEHISHPPTPDPVNHPDHYKWLPVEAIEITEHFNFCLGNALKYIMRADRKGNPEQDIKKAIWYLERELHRRKSEG